MKAFQDYDRLYPDLVLELLEYFGGVGSIKDRSVMAFCENHKNEKGEPLQPEIIDRICQRLCTRNIMSAIRTGTTLALQNNYACILKHDVWEQSRDDLRVFLNSIAYGFDYIYDIYKDIVVPLVWEKDDGKISVGSGFSFRNGIVTARHCILDPKSLSIKGYTAEELNHSKVIFHKNSNVDVAFIDTRRKAPHYIMQDTGRVLQDVLVLGYPKIPGFTDFLTGEKATVSSIAEARIIPTKGAIAAFATNIFTRTELLLITAKIRGGNSGGPVINDEGSIIGVACQTPYYGEEVGDYDDLGYGVAVPMKHVLEMLQDPEEYHVEPDFFRDYLA